MKKNPLLWPWEREEKPFFVNDEGFEWYIDEDTTGWAHRENGGVSLLNIVGFIVRKDGESIDRVLMDKETNKVIYSNTSLEAIASHIDILKAVKRFENGKSK